MQGQQQDCVSSVTDCNGLRESKRLCCFLPPSFLKFKVASGTTGSRTQNGSEVITPDDWNKCSIDWQGLRELSFLRLILAHTQSAWNYGVLYRSLFFIFDSPTSFSKVSYT